jgi:hypothetical protein
MSEDRANVAVLPWGTRIHAIGDGFGMMGQASETMFLGGWEKGDRATAIKGTVPIEAEAYGGAVADILIAKYIEEDLGFKVELEKITKLGVVYDTDGVSPIHLFAANTGIEATMASREKHKEWLHYYPNILESPDAVLHALTNRLIYILGWRVVLGASCAAPGLMKYFHGPTYTPGPDGRDPDLEDAIDKHGKWKEPKWSDL